MRLKPRFSILNVLLVTTVVVLVIVVVRLNDELNKERSQRVELLQKGGILQLTDADRIHLVKVSAAGEEGASRWRVYVPEERTLVVDARLDDAPADKPLAARLPPNAIVDADRSPVKPLHLEPGEHVISLSCSRDGSTMRLDVVHDGQRKGRSFGSPPQYVGWWRQDLTHFEHKRLIYQQFLGGRTLTIDDGETFVLARFRALGWEVNSGSDEKPLKKVSEILVWLHADEP
jgi:hypothetical protein